MNHEYTAYLLSDGWKEKRRQKLKEQRSCEICGTKSILDIHHLTYDRLFKEQMEDLMVLCRHHHDQVEGLYKAGKITKKGCPRALKKQTQEAILADRPKITLEPQFWGITQTTERAKIVSILLQHPDFWEALRRDREKAKYFIKKAAKNAGNLQNKIYINMLMTYDAFHGIAYRKFRREVLEIAKLVNCPVPNPSVAESEVVGIPNVTVRPAPKPSPKTMRPRLDFDVVAKSANHIFKNMEAQGVRVESHDGGRLLAMISSWIGSMGADIS